MVETQLLYGVQRIHCIGEADELHSNNRVVGSGVVYITLGLQAATDERRQQGTGAKIFNVTIVDYGVEQIVFSLHP